MRQSVLKSSRNVLTPIHKKLDEVFVAYKVEGMVGRAHSYPHTQHRANLCEAVFFDDFSDLTGLGINAPIEIVLSVPKDLGEASEVKAFAHIGLSGCRIYLEDFALQALVQLPCAICRPPLREVENP